VNNLSPNIVFLELLIILQNSSLINEPLFLRGNADRSSNVLFKLLYIHLGPHNKGPSLRVQGLHQHLQAVRLLHTGSGTGTITGLHG